MRPSSAALRTEQQGLAGGLRAAGRTGSSEPAKVGRAQDTWSPTPGARHIVSQGRNNQRTCGDLILST